MAQPMPPARDGWEPGGLHGLGKTPIIALADLFEKEEERLDGDKG